MVKFGININTTKDIDGSTVNYISSIIKKHTNKAEIKIFEDSLVGKEELLKGLDVIIVLGGDGTILSAARTLVELDIPILGVNIGHLGFLASVEISEFEDAIIKLCKEEYYIEERIMLKCETEDLEEQYLTALNDVVICKGTLSRIADFEIDIEKDLYTTFNADGVIISTPTGSTAYSLSAGGPIICPTLEVLSITPICPHTLEMRTLIADSKSKITVKVKTKCETEKMYLTIDGQHSIELGRSAEIKVTVMRNKCKLLKISEHSYFDILRKKILLRNK